MPALQARVMGELAYTVNYFNDNGLPLDRPWGQVQFDTRNGERIPVHGGSGVSGVYNAITHYGWVTLPFAEGDIRRDPNLKGLKLREKR